LLLYTSRGIKSTNVSLKTNDGESKAADASTNARLAQNQFSSKSNFI
jgi:hypothetical protein